MPKHFSTAQYSRWVYKRKINFKSLTDQMKLVYKSILENGFDFQKNNFQKTLIGISLYSIDAAY